MSFNVMIEATWLLISNSSFALILISRILRISTVSFEQSIPSGHNGANFLLIPLSFGMTAVTKKKISNRKAISAVEPALISG